MRFKQFYFLNEIKGKKYDYSCILFDFPKQISMEIQNWCKFNIKDEELAEDGRENETHVTILYGVHDADPSMAFALLDGVKPFEITLGQITKFDAPDCDVLKIDVVSDDLFGLRHILEFGIRNTQTHIGYKPHVTLAFVKKGSCDRFIGSNQFEGRTVLLNAIDFSSKDGSRQRKILQ